ncbi:MAG: long-chain fatty acid--CoA ligase [Cytophagales bacterium]|nr:long-chain fatty acid--CoA ligase [Cytophagales bacterium]
MKTQRLFDLLEYQLENTPQENAFAKKENGEWITYSTQEAVNYANNISLGLLELGIKKQEKVAIISMNRPEWNFVDYGIQQIGAVSVPMYPTITVEDYNYIFKDAGVKAVFVSDAELYAKVQEAVKDIEGIVGIYTFDKVDGAQYWEEVSDLGSDKAVEDLKLHKAGVDETDLLTLIYTSGTTGKPKGVMLNHSNLMSNVLATEKILPVDAGSDALSFLPLCHVYERMLTYLYVYAGVSIYYAESMETIGDNLKEVKPHIFSTVPRLLEKVYDKIYAKGLELSGIKRKLFFWALELGHKFELNKNQGFWYNFQLNLANKLIFSKWREALGGNVRLITSGSAALQPRLATVFWSANIPVLEGYGLTETSPVISVNKPNPDEVRIGTVGPLIEGIEVKIAEDGEILTRGPHIMQGYYNKPDKTAEVIDEDGWFHTGDIGTMVEGKYLKITDRKKDQFKTSGGKYIYPQMLENKFKESVLIEQIMITGEFRKFPGALIVPSFEGLRDYCGHKGIPYTTDAEMLKLPQIMDKFQREVDKFNESFAQYEKVKRFELLPTSWTIETGELTPTMKCKRKVIKEKYADAIERIYDC